LAVDIHKHKLSKHAGMLVRPFRYSKFVQMEEYGFLKVSSSCRSPEHFTPS
jgi:hypothetical protein